MIEKTWASFTLLLWKNMIVHWNHKQSVVYILLTPTIFSSILALLRYEIAVETIPMMATGPLPLEYKWSALMAEIQHRHELIKNKTGKDVYNVFLPRKIIAYAPSNYEAFNNIIQLAHKDKLPGTELKAFDRCAKLRETMQREFYFAGVCFNDTVMNVSTGSIHKVGIYPNHFTFSLVFPSELRVYNSTHIAAHWTTDRLFSVKDRNDYLQPNRPDNGLINYIGEGFINIQYAVSKAYIRLISNKTTSELPKITLTHFPTPDRIYDHLNDNLEVSLPFLIIISYISPATYFIKYVLVEKESRNVNIMNSLYARNGLLFIAWIVPGFLVLLGASILAVILLTIRWNNGYGILSYSSAFVILLLLMSYDVSILCFTFMVGNLFTRATTGMCVTSLVLVMSYIPYILIVRNRNEEVALLTWIAYIFPNSILGLGFQTILDYEVNNKVLGWQALFKATDSRPNLSVGACILICYGLAILYGSISIFFGEINVYAYIFPEGVNGFFSNCFSQNTARTQGVSAKPRNMFARTMVYEVQPSYKHLVVEFKNVSKEIDGKRILEDISFNLYEDECTVLMGHNGSGKSMLMSIGIGLTNPTSGSVFINKYNLQDTPLQDRIPIGVYVSDCLLFYGITVENQLTFFCHLRGLDEKDTKAEVQKFLNAMELVDKRHVLTENLTNGLRHRLALCTALVGGTKIVMLDEPCSNSDLSARKLMWELLYREKKGRTIFMVSHSYIEAEAIADRVLILSKGALQCCGSTYFLRNLYGHGYRLILYKGPHCQSDRVTELFRKYIPKISPISDFYAELSYVIYDKYEDRIVPFVSELNLYLEQLDIITYSLSEITMEDVFYNVGTERPGTGDRKTLKIILNGKTPYSEDENFLFLEPQFPSKYQLWLRQWQAMLYKHYIITKFHRKEILTYLLAIMICTTASIAMFKESQPSLSRITYELNQYEETVTIVDTRQSKAQIVRDVEEMYYQSIFWNVGLHKIEETLGKSFIQHVNGKLKDDIFAMREKYVIAVTFSENHIMAWFNNMILHTAPLSLNMVFNALLHALLDPNAKIAVILDPLPFNNTFSNGRDLMATEAHLSLGNLLGTNVALCICYMGAFSFIYVIEERQKRFKFLQLRSGLRLSTFWLSAFCFAFIKLLCAVVIFALAIWFTFDLVFLLPYVAGWCVVFFLATGIAVISINYAFSFLFKDRMNAYQFITTYHIIGCVSGVLFVDVYSTDFNVHFDISCGWQWIFRIFPLYSFFRAVIILYTMSLTDVVCKDEAIALISTEFENCTAVPNCCEDPYLLPMDEDLLINFISLIVMCFVGWIIIFLNETSILWHWRDIPHDHEPSALDDFKRSHSMFPTSTDNSDVIYERIKVDSLTPRDRTYSTVFCHQVGKIFNNVSVVSRLSFYLEPAEIFCLLGHNGAGKTMLLKLLVGDEPISYGEAYIKNINMTTNAAHAMEYIGYSPSTNALNLNFTICEMLKLFCLLQGVEYDKIPAICENIAKLLGLFAYYNETLLHCSQGIKMRTQHAVVIMTKPAVLCLDLPTAHVDLASTRQLWNVLNELRQRNRTTIIFTSLFPRESQRYSTKLAILQSGRFDSIGSPVQVANKHPVGYCVYAKLKKNRGMTISTFLSFATFMQETFPTSVLREHYCSTVVYFIPRATYNIGYIFATLKSKLFDLELETFFVTREKIALVLLDSMENGKSAISKSLRDV